MPKAIGVVLLLLAGVVQAATITPVSVDASSTFYTYDKDNLINGSGLSGPANNQVHDTDFHNMWLNSYEGAAGTLTFDLGGVYNLTSTTIWQYNATCCGLNRGVRDFDIYTSIDGINFSLLSTETLNQSFGGFIEGQSKALVATAGFVRFDIQSNYGDTLFTGLSEVRFHGNVVPIPAAAWLFASGLGVLGWFRRRAAVRGGASG